jgi:hypothetical protein
MLLAGCSNIFAPRIEARSSGGTGTGTVRIDLEGASSASRTLLPARIGGFAKYDLLFTDQAGMLSPLPVPDYEPNAEVTLAEGTWTVTVSAYLSDGVGGDYLAAVGEATVQVIYQMVGETVPVILRPVDTTASYTGYGTFAWDISFPASTETATLTIAKPDGTLVKTLSLKGPASDGTLTPEGDEDRSEGSIDDLPAGSYYAQTTLTRPGAKARRKDALFILEGMTTTADVSAGYAFTFDSFNRTIYVTSAADSGPGSLRQAIGDAADDDVIQVALPPGSVIVLGSVLTINNKSLVIEGNGVTLTGGGSGLLSILGYSKEVSIRRMRFKDSSNGAIRIGQATIVTLESCIFSDNKSFNTAGGRTVRAYGSDLTVLGCTFYNNSASGDGGALYIEGGIVRLGGNLFYGNTATYGNNVLYSINATVTSLGYNASDLPGGAVNDPAGSGFYFLPTDRQIALNSISPISRFSFKPYLSSGVLGMTTPSAIEGYPTADFYGDSIPATAAPGAVQSLASDTSHSLQIAVQGSGTFVPGGALPGEDGLYLDGAQVTLIATPASGWYPVHWTVNGVKQEGNPATVTLNEDTEALAVFGRLVDAADEAALRAALNDQQDYDIITLTASGDKTIPINSALPAITKSIVIEGNGSTLVRKSSFGALLAINNSVVIRRLHFKGSSILANDSALHIDVGGVTLESCVFSGNLSSTAGAAIRANEGVSGNKTLMILGCTFYDNETTGTVGGGAISAGRCEMKLAGNLFYGNSSASGYNVTLFHENYSIGTATTSLGYNVSDYAGGTDPATGSGFEFAGTDRHDASGTVSPASFKPVLGSYALDAVDVLAFNSANPTLSYPTHDFYGNAITPGSAAAGAVQGGVTGYGLSVIVQGSGQFEGLPTFGPDGLVAPGASFTLQAVPATGADYLISLTVDGAAQGGDTFTVTNMDKDMEVLAVFRKFGTVPVTTEAEFLAALAEPGCDVISLPPNGVITITGSGWKLLTRDLVIEGNGATLDSSDPLFYMESAVNVSIRRVHFKNAKSGAIYHYLGSLTLESCIFSDNHATNNYYGGAITADGGILNVLGCTFYNNSTLGKGGAINVNDGTVQLGGNLFYGNTASSAGNVVYRNAGTVKSLGGNVSDSVDSGYTAFGTDTTVNTLSFSEISFKPSLNSPALNMVDVDAFNSANTPLTYPTHDFYNDAIAGTAAAGAVQTPGTGYPLRIVSSGDGTVVPNLYADSDGFYESATILTLTASVNGILDHASWTVDNAPPQTGGSIQITMDGNKEVRVELWRRVAINSEATLRQALTTGLQDYDVIYFDAADIPGKTITLSSSLSVINNNVNNLIIEGNGCVLTCGASFGNILYFNSANANVVIRRLHFKNANIGEAFVGLYINAGKNFTLESCIFSDNFSVTSGGAILYYSPGNYLTVLGCTFYNNRASANGGAIYVSNGNVRLKGNLFYGNTAGYSVGNVMFQSSGTTVSLGYNVSDYGDGTDGATGSGFTFVGDKTLTNPTQDPLDALDGTHPYKPAASLSDIKIVDTSAMPDYPADFYGTIRSGTVPAGAVAEY